MYYSSDREKSLEVNYSKINRPEQNNETET